MLNRILPLLNKYIPTALAFKGIQKISPTLKKFATGAVASGYTTDQVIDYLRGRVSGERNEDFGSRPEEQASKAQVENSKQLPNALRTGAALAGGAIGGLSGLGLGAASLLGNSDENEQSIDPKLDSKQSALNKFNARKKNSMTNTTYENEELNKNKLYDRLAQSAEQLQQPENQGGIDPALAQILQQGQAFLQKFRGGNG